MTTDDAQRDDRPLLLALFARAPVPGKAKTRLAADLGVAQTAKVAEGLIRETVRLCAAHWPGELVLTVWPSVDHPLFDELSAEYGLRIEVQGPGDLGDKMLHALHDGLADGYRTAVMGCDAPHCPAQALSDAASAMRNGTNVYGPAQDGGFWILGLVNPAPGLFAGIDWEAPETGARTLESAAAAGVTLAPNLPELFDIDTIAEYQRFVEEYPAIARRISTTGE